MTPGLPQPRTIRGRAIGGALAALALFLTGCTGSGPAPATSGNAASSTPPPPMISDFNPQLVAAAKEEAKANAGGQQLGGKVTFIGSTGGAEGQLLQTLFQPFTEATGIAVDYQGTSNVDAIVQTQLAAGKPPDFVQQNSIGGMFGYAQKGVLTPLDSFIDKNTLDKNFAPSVISGLSSEGHLYGAPAAINTFQVWYNPKVYTGPKDAMIDQLLGWATNATKAGARAPFCMNLNQGSNSATIAIYFIEDIFLKKYGPVEFEKWARGDIKYTSEEVKSVYQEVLDLFTHNLVQGGAQGALTTPIIQSPTGLFTNPPGCELLHWGSFTPGVIAQANPNVRAGVDYDYFNMANSSASFPKTIYAAPWTSYAMTNTPQLQAFVKYYTSTAFQTLVASTGHWVMANKAIPSATYPSAVQQKLATDFGAADTIEFGPFLNASAAGYQHQKDAFMELVANPTNLDKFLQGMDSSR